MRVGSLFSGIGGIDLGFMQAGFEIAWANEIDPCACKTYRHNFPTTALIEGTIRNLDPSSLSNIDVLTAGFPCQPFSVMGYQRGFNDPRGNLFFEILKFIDIKRPKAVFLENVRNLMEHDNGKTFLVIYNTLVQFGYSIKYRVINATEANLPQDRARIFIVAFQSPEHCDHFSFPPPLLLSKSIEDILDRKTKQSNTFYYNSASKYFDVLKARISEQSGIFRIDDSGIAKKRYEVCPTLKANMGTFPDRVPIIRDAFGIRKITPEECLAFQGFPKEFKFNGIPLHEAYKQSGNTVAVPLVRRIAKKIRSALTY